MSISRSAVFYIMALLFSSSLHGAGPPCGSDVDGCVRTLIVETAGIITACGKAFPAAQTIFDTALKNWPVRKLPVPGLAPLLVETAPSLAQAQQNAAAYLEGLSPEERQTQCSARLAMLTQPTPSLSGDSVSLPPDALKKYSK